MLSPYPNVLISITSIPRRFDKSLREVIGKLQEAGEPVVVCLPRCYDKWGRALVPDYLDNYSNVVVFQPSKDYGPATKLLGAIEYMNSTKKNFDAIITFDDDLYYADTSAAINYLRLQGLERPGCAITIGGLKLQYFPYRWKNGAYGNNVGYVDIPLGFRGVYYPARVAHDSRIFDFASEMPKGAFNNDDAYFGICLSRMNVPVFAVKPPRIKLVSIQGAGGSAVEEKTDMHRIENEMQIFQYGVSKGWLPNKMTKNNPDSPLRKVLVRSSIGRKLLRWHFNW